MTNKRRIAIFGAPYAGGQKSAGVARGPQVLRNDGLIPMLEKLRFHVQDCGDVEIDHLISQQLCNPPKVESNGENEALYDESEIKQCRENAAYCKKLYDSLTDPGVRGSFVLTVGGDHSIGMPTVLARLAEHRDLCVLWIDAHGDCNTPTSSPSAHYHGMPAAHAMGLFAKKAPFFDWMDCVSKLDPKRFALLGVRSMDPAERAVIKGHNICCCTMDDIVADGVVHVLQRALGSIDPESNRPIHISWDIDVMDPTEAPGSGTLCRGGLLYREARVILREIRRTGRLVSMDMVECNPEQDHPDIAMHGDPDGISDSASKTSRLALQLIHDALIA